jgi:hypothetical protein
MLMNLEKWRMKLKKKQKKKTAERKFDKVDSSFNKMGIYYFGNIMAI